MLGSALVALLVGVVLGFLSGLGVGGGTLLILWLTQVIGMDPSVARTVNLLFFIAAAGSVSLLRIKKKQIPWKKIYPAVLAGCLSAWLFSALSEHLPRELLEKLFGGLLLITGIKELFYRAK